MVINEDKQVLDANVLAQYTGGDESVALRIYRRFLTQTKSDVGVLRAAFGNSAIPEIAGSAHRIKGSSLMVGAGRQSELSERIELAAGSGDLDSARAAMEEFEREHARLIEHLVAIVGE